MVQRTIRIHMNSKKILRIFLFLSMAFGFINQTLLAGTFGKFTYEVEGDSIIITGYPRDASGAVAIPSVIADKPVTRIGQYAFSKCTGLTSVEIPDSVTRIGGYAFFYCSGLTSMDIPNSVTRIGRYAFHGCSGLTSVDIPSSVTRIISNAFGLCTGLTSLKVDSDNPAFSSKGGVLFDKDKTRLILRCPGLKGDYVIPDSVTRIGRYAFRDGTGLTSVSIPDSVTHIGRYAFQGCSGLTSVGIPNSVIHIGSGAFASCSGLTSVGISNSVTRIRTYTFAGCTGLTSVDIPNSVTSIGSHAFMDSDALEKATFSGNAPIMGLGVFEQTSATFKIYYLKGKKGFTSPKWKGYPTVELNEAPEAVNSTEDVSRRSGDWLSTTADRGLAFSFSLAAASWTHTLSSTLMSTKSATTTEVIDGRKYLTLAVIRPSGMNLMIEVSPDLIDWYSGKRHTTVVTDDASLLKVRDNTPLAPGTKRYIRVKAMAP